MNIIDENFVEKSKKEKTKMSKIILIIIAILVIAIIGIIIALGYIDNAQLKVTVDGQLQEKVKDMLVFDGDTVYISIRDIASYVGYQSYSGDYAERSEAKNKCYIQNDDEIANFVLGSNKIYKLETQKTNSDYTYFYAKKPVKAINGKLYISSDGFQEAFNSSFIYNQDTNRIKIYTMNYLISSYQQTVLDKGFAEMSSEFHNEKSIFEERLVVQKDKKQLGVIDLKGNTIIESDTLVINRDNPFDQFVVFQVFLDDLFCFSTVDMTEYDRFFSRFGDFYRGLCKAVTHTAGLSDYGLNTVFFKIVQKVIHRFLTTCCYSTSGHGDFDLNQIFRMLAFFAQIDFRLNVIPDFFQVGE